jgi:hypothetical protein
VDDQRETQDAVWRLPNVGTLLPLSIAEATECSPMWHNFSLRNSNEFNYLFLGSVHTR